MSDPLVFRWNCACTLFSASGRWVPGGCQGCDDNGSEWKWLRLEWFESYDPLRLHLVLGRGRECKYVASFPSPWNGKPPSTPAGGGLVSRLHCFDQSLAQVLLCLVCICENLNLA